VLRRAWSQPEIREHFSVNGWADGLRRGYFSVSAREAAEARFWFWASDSEAEVCTCFPDNWYKDDRRRRKRSRGKFLGALHLDLDRSPRWLEWEFQLPAQQRHLEDRIVAVANAVHSFLVKEAPTRAGQLGRGKAYPDFDARQKKIFGNRPIHLNIGEILRKERSRF
jgi:hypothetical protein